MSWHLQQINNPNDQGPAVPGEYVACPQATAAAVGPAFVCTFGDQQHFTYADGNYNFQDCWYDGATNRWNLQQINNGTGGPDVPGEPVACPQAPRSAGSLLLVCTFGDQQHFTYSGPTDYPIQDCWYDGLTDSWNLQQINNPSGHGPAVPGEFVACPQAPANGGGSVFVCTFGDQQHFTYFDSDANIQDCWYDGATNRWNLQQINNGLSPAVPGEFVACPQAPAASFGVGLCVGTFGDQQHFAYGDGSGNIQDCWYDGATNGWNLQQINNAGGQGPSVPGEPVACPRATAGVLEGSFLSVCTLGDQQHFAYLDGNGNIQDCWYDGATNGWNLQQINNAGGQGPSVPGEFVACPQATAALNEPASPRPIVCTLGDQQHFAYLDGNGNIQDCWYDGATNGWNLQQINNAGGQGPSVPGEFVACPQATAGASLGPFVCTFGDQQHFTYLDGNGNIHDCWWG